MIYVVLCGRLGNQLFEYATALNIAKKYNQDVCLLEFKEKNRLNQFAFYNAIKKADVKNIIFAKLVVKVYEKIFFLYCLFCRCNKNNEPILRYDFDKKNMPLLAKMGLVVVQNGYIELPELSSKNIFMYGFFQSEKYFCSIKDELKMQIKPINLDARLLNLRNDIIRQEFACIHVRMGDYTDNDIFGVCTKNYYQRAIKKMIEIHRNVKFLLVSDEIDKAKKMINFYEAEVIYEDSNYEDFETLYYMSACKHFILSNSSFSWWGQYLSDYVDKTVIAPERWMNVRGPFNDIYMEDWILLKTGDDDE